MKAQVNSCQAQVEHLEGNLANWLTVQLDSPTPFNTNQIWHLWVEPIARATQAKCPVYFIGKGNNGVAKIHSRIDKEKDAASVTQMLEANWQFKECYVFISGKTIHGLTTEQGSYIRTITPDTNTMALAEQSSPQQRTPYLQQDLSRFDLAFTNADEDLSTQSLTFNRFYCPVTEQMEYVLIASQSGSNT